MEVEVKLKSLAHEELSDILTTAFYGNHEMEMDYEGTPSEVRLCFEDNAAQVLLDGGTILVTDLESYGDSIDDAYGTLPKYIDADGYITYKVTLKDILEKASTPECLRMIQDILFGDGDMYTAWNLMQTIVFGEIIYG